MQLFEISIEGASPLLHHRFSEEAVLQLLGAKSKKKTVKEEKTPREIAEEYAYKTTDGKYYIPTSYVSGAFRESSSDYKQVSSSRKSYKSIAAGIFLVQEEYAILTDKKGKPLPDFEVDLRKATNHLKGAVAVCRPRFDKWFTKFTVELDTDIIPVETARQILTDAGRKVGIGSFRVSKGGPFGRFSVVEFKQISK